MSNRGSNNGSGGGGGLQSVSSIPAGSRKIVQSLKEIVNCPEPEIYAMLKECNMDPNEAVNRLLSQDPFREVKSKREKKKENKEPIETRSRGVGSTSSRGRGSSDRYSGRGGSTQYNFAESGISHGKSALKKDNGANFNRSYPSSAHEVEANKVNQHSTAFSDAVVGENKVSAIGTVDGSSASQPSFGCQSAWGGVPGQRTMADIVKMGKPHNKASSTPNPSNYGVNEHHIQRPGPAVSHHDLYSSEDYTSKVSEMNHEPGIGPAQHYDPNDEWPLDEQVPATTVPSELEAPAESEMHPDTSNLAFESISRHPHFHTDQVRDAEDGEVENLRGNHVGSISIRSRDMPEDNSGRTSLYDDDLYRNMSPYQSLNQGYEPEEAEDEDDDLPGSSVAANMKQLNIHEEKPMAQPQEDGPSVVIPSHLQVQAADCSHLSFGSFGSGINVPFSGAFTSKPQKTNLDDVPTEADSDTRNHEYYGDEPLQTASDGNMGHRTGGSAGGYDSPSTSQPEVLKQENPELAHGIQHNFPSSAPGYEYENSQQLHNALPQSQTSSQLQNLATFSNVMAHTNSLPSTLLAANAHAVRDSDISYSPFPMTQPMPTRYGNMASSLGGSTISMPEALKSVVFSSTQPTSQIHPGTSLATGPTLPQQLAVHPYSQPTLPMGPFANMISYPFLPQGYTYMPSAFQQGFAGNSTYHQSLAAMPPQYKSSVSVSSLPQSAAIASGYGALGASANVPGNFQMSPPTAPGGTTIGYEDVLSSQFKDTNHLISLQQNENPAMWLHGAGSRTMSAIPPNTYYSIQGQNQQAAAAAAGFRQAQHQQQPSQSYGGGLNYPNFYPSQSGMSLEHQQQNPRDGSLVGSQASQPKQQQPSQQLWQNSY